MVFRGKDGDRPLLLKRCVAAGIRPSREWIGAEGRRVFKRRLGGRRVAEDAEGTAAAWPRLSLLVPAALQPRRPSSPHGVVRRSGPERPRSEGTWTGREPPGGARQRRVRDLESGSFRRRRSHDGLEMER